MRFVHSPGGWSVEAGSGLCSALSLWSRGLSAHAHTHTHTDFFYPLRLNSTFSMAPCHVVTRVCVDIRTNTRTMCKFTIPDADDLDFVPPVSSRR